MTARATAESRPKPHVGDLERWKVAMTGEPISDDTIAALARLLVDRAKQRVNASPEQLDGGADDET